jgi:hypothetical protein
MASNQQVVESRVPGRELRASAHPSRGTVAFRRRLLTYFGCAMEMETSRIVEFAHISGLIPADWSPWERGLD